MSTDGASILNELIQITKDSEEGFRTAAENVKDSFLKETFLEKAEGCNQIISDLQDKVLEMDGDPENAGTLLGAMHRGWVSIKGTLTGKDDHSILEECERGEDVIKAAYSKALESNLPVDLRSLIEEKYKGVVKDHDLIRDLRDKYAA
jgi:uncharacterized protein (TIGR02284 family)